MSISNMHISLSKKLCSLWIFGGNGPNFKENSTKLRNEALIRKKCKNKSWMKLNSSSGYVNIAYVCMLVCQKNYVLCSIFGGKWSKFQQNYKKKHAKHINFF